MKTTIQLTLLLLAYTVSGVSQTTDSTTRVKTDKGVVEGNLANHVISYKGIPFASPPVGDLRWRPPQPAAPWNGVLKADKFAPACIQPDIPMLGYTHYGISEDCLYLNVWKPAQPSSDNLPVMVWIHGGGFSLGSPSQSATTGEQLASKGMVVVSIAYRLGALGFLALPELSAESDHHCSGNYGLLDQIAGLQWVKRNIRAFGGNPDCVTIFGESAGGQSVSMLAASPLTKGLFQRAICQSGGSFGPVQDHKEFDCMQTLKGAEQTGIEFERRMGAKSVKELRSMDVKKFQNDPSAAMGGFWPIADGYVIMGDQYLLYQQKKYNDVPVLIGYTSDDGNLFVISSKTDDFQKSVRERFGPLAGRILGLYPTGDEETTRQSMANVFRDSFFGWYTYAWASLQTQTGRSPVFVYLFDQVQPASPVTILLKSDKPYHGSDVAYVFGSLDLDPKIKYTPEDHQLSETMMKYWVNFATKGDPNGEGLPVWPVYNTEHPMVMDLKGIPQAIPEPDLDRLKAFNAYYTWKRTSGK